MSPSEHPRNQSKNSAPGDQTLNLRSPGGPLSFLPCDRGCLPHLHHPSTLDHGGHVALEKLLASRASVSSSVNGTRVSDRIEKSQNVTQLLSPLSCHHGNETCLLRCEKSSLAKSTCARTSVPQSPPRVCTVHLGNWDLRCSPEHPVTVQNPKIHGKAVWESQPDSSLRIYGQSSGRNGQRTGWLERRI